MPLNTKSVDEFIKFSSAFTMHNILWHLHINIILYEQDPFRLLPNREKVLEDRY